MSGKIFYRERTNIGEGDQAPRFVVVAVADLKLKFRAKHMRKDELEQIAAAMDADLVELKVEGKGHKLDEIVVDEE
ncbi:MAG: hypothetical protein RQ731_09635 [Anaerosomatales bacterium]|nr:hypothetical protein [Anaerosomatales bacterium]MDT8435000.1 hypothetical protein [Anaerosomatales bacterium]